MSTKPTPTAQPDPPSPQPVNTGVMLNAYPDSIGTRLSDAVAMLKKPAFKDTFSLFYILPTFFNSDLDRGFSIIDYNINEELVSEQDLAELDQLDIQLKFDIVLNHLSVASPQFLDLLEKGDRSAYKDFFIDWNEFWKGFGKPNDEGVIVPDKPYLDKLFMRKPGLPILKVLFPDGTERPYWNTFYQKVSYSKISTDDLVAIESMSAAQAVQICEIVNRTIDENGDPGAMDWGDFAPFKREVLSVVNQHRHYLGQMDVNAKSPLVWEFYEEVLAKLAGFGCKILRLDAFAYLHKAVGESNFFNVPGTWDYLSRINEMAQKHQLLLLPEIHAEYGTHLHEEVAGRGYFIYDFFLPGLIIHALEKGSNKALIKWVREIIEKGYKTVNMLGCHDGIPVLDLRGKEVDGVYQKGLLSDEEIEEMMDLILARGGRVKNLYGPDGEKISYYQVNATYFSALGEDEQKLLLARAIQLFMPGIPQIWYLDLFAGTNDYGAADAVGAGGHKEINRTTLSMQAIEEGLKKEVVQQQLELIRLRNTSAAFSGTVEFGEVGEGEIDIVWRKGEVFVQLKASLVTYAFEVHSGEG